ncbi:MAG TPA: hypothetical protein VMN60_05745 [Longimicrobiales bacterium]|nr:hypothetical protein [Longimicrobiales bacterium]
MRRILTAVLLSLVLVPASAQAQQTRQQQQRAPTAAERAAYAARRDSLEREIVNKFVDRLTRELRLNAEQRGHTERVLRESGDRRRELISASRELRTRMYRAARESATTDADFSRLLTEFEMLRVREHNLWQREQDELARLYSPRQRVQFVVSWTQFQESLREILSDRMRQDGRH